MSKVVTRFAPSPTGYLHIGGARTALYNYLYARHTGGEFKLRIEDTDAERNSPEAIDAIIAGMAWLGLGYHGEPVYQSANADRHRKVAYSMLARGHAYCDYTTPEEMAVLRAAWNEKHPSAPFRYDHPQRDVHTNTPFIPGRPFVLRLRAPREGETVIDDLVQGRVSVENIHALDDMVLLRSDGSPTYMLAVVVDDHDMGVTHVIRGDDHLNNAFRQLPIYRAMEWPEPFYAHIPLIHNEQGKKLSKRNGDAAVTDYLHKGIIDEAMFNYLLKLGWGHGDDEIISRKQAIEWFDIVDVGRAPARLDAKKLEHINAHYLRAKGDHTLAAWTTFKLRTEYDIDVTADGEELLVKAMPSLKMRATNMADLVSSAVFYFRAPDIYVEADFTDLIETIFDGEFTATAIEARVREHCVDLGAKMKNVVAPLRLAITGKPVSPPLFEAMALLGEAEVKKRLEAAAADRPGDTEMAANG